MNPDLEAKREQRIREAERANENVFWLLHDEEGRIFSHGEATRRQAAMQQVEGYTMRLHDDPSVTIATHHVPAGVPVARPVAPLPAGGPTPCDLGLASYTPGTVLRIHLNTGPVEFVAPGDGTPLEIDVAGEYHVEVVPPFPERPSYGIVEVTDA